jgi:hypothetical protein
MAQGADCKCCFTNGAESAQAIAGLVPTGASKMQDPKTGLFSVDFGNLLWGYAQDKSC